MKRIGYLILLLGTIVLALCACGTQGQSSSDLGKDYSELKKTGAMQLSYATKFSVEDYEQYKVIHVEDGGDYIVVPKGEKIPANLPEDMVVLKQPLDKTYLVSTAAMDPVAKIGAIGDVRLSGSRAEDWSIEEAVQAMKEKKILFAGKYSQPDYELILNEGCNLALENTMIFHNPEAKEKLEELGIPVFIEKSSYEEHPFGRLEWMKLFGVLYNREQEATEYFNRQIEKIAPVIEKESTGKRVAFFYITANGVVNVRKPKDYISSMIELAGGEYALNDLLDVEENALSTTNIQMEDFYVYAKDADVIIYNSAIVGELDTIDDLIEKNALFKDFKSVKNKEVYCTYNDFFQQATKTCDFVEDLHRILIKDDTKELSFIKKLR